MKQEQIDKIKYLDQKIKDIEKFLRIFKEPKEDNKYYNGIFLRIFIKLFPKRFMDNYYKNKIDDTLGETLKDDLIEFLEGKLNDYKEELEEL